MLSTNERLVVNLDEPRLPEDKRDRWRVRGVSWSQMNEEERRRWREWFEWAISPGGEFWDASRRRANLSGMSLGGADLSRLNLAHANLERANLYGADLTQTDLRWAELSSAMLEQAQLVRTRLNRSTLSNAKLSGADLSGADLSEATLHHTDLTRVDFKDAKLFATRITDPVWWIDLPKATLSGRVEFQSGMPRHAIQDVVGLPPLLRRQIADAQHLADMHRKSRGVGRAIIWSWGMTCGFGQSLGRLSITAIFIILLFVVAYMVTDFSLVKPTADNTDTIRYVGSPDFWQAGFFAITTFTAPGTSGMFPLSTLGKALLAVQGVICFLLLGGLLSIFANKLARLA